jgi:phospholipid-transporting ATPase
MNQNFEFRSWSIIKYILYISQKTREVIIQRCLDFGIDLKCQNDVALIIDGSTLDYALSCDIRMDFLELCSACKVVICCRVSPIQKAEVML